MCTPEHWFVVILFQHFSYFLICISWLCLRFCNYDIYYGCIWECIWRRPPRHFFYGCAFWTNKNNSEILFNFCWWIQTPIRCVSVCVCVYIHTHKLLGCSEAGAGAYSSLDFGISHQMPLIMDADSVACIFVGRSL